MDVGTNGRVFPSSRAQHASSAEDILFNWLLQVPIGVDLADAARVALTAAPMRAGETPLQRWLRGLLVEVSRSPQSALKAQAGRSPGRRR